MKRIRLHVYSAREVAFMMMVVIVIVLLYWLSCVGERAHAAFVSPLDYIQLEDSCVI